MSEDPFHEAVEALRALGRKVEPANDDMSLWRVDDEEMSDAGLMKLAVLLGLVLGSATIQ